MTVIDGKEMIWDKETGCLFGNRKTFRSSLHSYIEIKSPSTNHVEKFIFVASREGNASAKITKNSNFYEYCPYANPDIEKIHQMRVELFIDYFKLTEIWVCENNPNLFFTA